MSLSLFLNNERTSSEGVFFREITQNPYTVQASVKFDDVSIKVPSRYAAVYKLNDSIEEKFFDLTKPQAFIFTGSIPCVSSIEVIVKDGDGTSLQTMKLSCKFVTKFPEISFIAYPSYYIDKELGLKSLTSSNYLVDSPGVLFYGEGHTEIINLSSNVINTSNPSEHIEWLIGNDLSNIASTSEYKVNKVPGTTTATVSISSESFDDKLIPISVVAYNNEITIDEAKSSVVKYDDVTGEKSFYPFFSTSLSVNGIPESADKFRSSIKINPYPTKDTYSYYSPFSHETISLPLDFSTKILRASVTLNSSRFSSLLTTLSSTKWELKQFSKIGDWEYKTKDLEKITVYEFPLRYNEIVTGQIPELFTIPLGEKTTVTLSVSTTFLAHFNFLINEKNDWIPRSETELHTAVATILPLPFAEIFVSDYFIEKTKELTINNIKIYADERLHLQKLLIKVDDNLDKEYEIDGDLKNFPPITFTRLGKRTLYIFATFLNEETNEVQEIKNTFENIIEVIDVADEVFVEEDPLEYRTEYSPLAVSYSTSAIPLIAPNDWAIADNVNYVLSTIYNTIDSILSHTVQYQFCDTFMGWLGNDKYAWSDLQCYSGTIPSSQWSKYVTTATFDQPEVESLVWAENSYAGRIIDPSCLQKYCIEWKWSSRTRRRSELSITWRSTKLTEGYKKRWKYESCEFNPYTISCPVGKWHTSTLDKLLYPSPFCSSKDSCSNVGFVITNKGKYIVARETEIFILDNLDEPTVLAKQTLADELFAFSKIEKIALSRESLLYVLDSEISKVSVFNVRPNDAILLSQHWGKLGSAANPYGFKNPKDLHITKDLEIIVVDTGNKCLKKYTSSGKHKSTFADTKFQDNPPLSVSTDSLNNLHVLTQDRVLIYNSSNVFIKEYLLPSSVIEPNKINFSFNGEISYITHKNGIVKFFRNGTIYGHLINNLKCKNGEILTGFVDVIQTSTHNLFICVKDKILKYADRMKFTKNSSLNKTLYWDLGEILINKNEYIQHSTYVKAFQKLWDNMELLRTSLTFADEAQAKLIGQPVVQKEDLVIGQNELVVNSVINRLSTQLWRNLESLVSYITPKTLE